MIIDSIINSIFQDDANTKNLRYAREMTQQQWERDDNAYQRAVSDLVSAGLSPLNAIGNPAGTSSPLTYQAQAPQFDINGTVEAIMQNKQMKQNQNQFDAKLSQDDLHFTKELQNDMDEFAKSFKLQQDRQTDDIKKAWKLLELQEQQLIDDQNQFKTQMEFEEFKNRQEKIQSLLPEGTTQIQQCETITEWQNAITQYKKDFQQYIKEHKEQLIESTSSGGGLNVAGVVGGNLNDATNMSTKAKKVLEMFYATHPFPVYVKDPFYNFDNQYSPYEKGSIINKE